MRSRIAWIVAGIAAVAIVAWIVTREHGDEPSRPGARTATGAVTAPGTGQSPAESKRSTPQPSRSIPPVRVGKPDDGDPLPEARDEGWASDTEQRLTPRITEIATETGTAIELACGTRTCRIRIEAADTAALGAAIGRLEEPGGGLYGEADALVVGAVKTTPEGRSTVALEATFDREDP